jgi:putative membrane protein
VLEWRASKQIEEEVMQVMRVYHVGPPMWDHGWLGIFGGAVPSLLLLILIGVGVWAVLRLTSDRAGSVRAADGLGPLRVRDGALEELRFRYARGEIGREEFVQRSRDLGSTEPPPGESSPPGEE